eukprot:351943-Chlamydomonas_euryale.AAC.11
MLACKTKEGRGGGGAVQCFGTPREMRPGFLHFGLCESRLSLMPSPRYEIVALQVLVWVARYAINANQTSGEGWTVGEVDRRAGMWHMYEHEHV